MYIVKIHDTYYLCKGIHQYYSGEYPLFTYSNYIQLNRIVSKEEAELLYSLISTPSNLCAGASLETIEL